LQRSILRNGKLRKKQENNNTNQVPTFHRIILHSGQCGSLT